MALIAFTSRPNDTALRWFGCLWLPLFLIAAAFAVWFETATTLALLVAAPLAAGSIIAGSVKPRVLRLIFVGLSFVTFPVGFALSHLTMAVIFFLVLTPIALAMRLRGRDALGLHLDREVGSYWIRHPPRQPVSRYFRQS